MVIYIQKKYIQKLNGCSPRNGIQHVYFPNGLSFEIKYPLDPETADYPYKGLIVPGFYRIRNFSKDINDVYACCATCQQTYFLSESMSFYLPEVCAYKHEPQIIVWCDPDDNVTIPVLIYVRKRYLVSVGSTPLEISLQDFPYVPFNCTLTAVNDNTGVEVFIETLDGYKVHIDHAHCHYRKIFSLEDNGEPHFTKTIDLSFHRGLLERTFQEKFGRQNNYRRFTHNPQSYTSTYDPQQDNSTYGAHQVNSTFSPSTHQHQRRFTHGPQQYASTYGAQQDNYTYGVHQISSTLTPSVNQNQRRFTNGPQQVNSNLVPSTTQGRFYPNAPLRYWNVLARDHANFQRSKGLTAGNYRENTSNGCACVNKNSHNPLVVIEIKACQCSSEKRNDTKTPEKKIVDNNRPKAENQRQKETFKNQNNAQVQDSNEVANFGDNGIPDYVRQPLPRIPPRPRRSYFKALNADHHLLEASNHSPANVGSIQLNIPVSHEQLPPPMLSFQRSHEIASDKELSGMLPSEVSEPSLNGLEPSLLRWPSMPSVKDTAHNSEADDEFDNEPSSSESDDEEEYFSCPESSDKPITSDADYETLLANFQVLNINMDAVNHMTAANDNDDLHIEDGAQVLSNVIV